MSYIIGIAGGSASGKTSFIEKLRGTFSSEEIAVLSQDHYYKPYSEQVTDHNGAINFDLPGSIYMDRFQRDIETLKSGKAIEIKEYTFNNPDRVPNMIYIEPARVIVVEGLFIFENKTISEMLDLKLFMEASEDIKLQRRLKRDMLERGLSHDDIRYQWDNHVKPAYEKYLLPHRENVDMVILNNTAFHNGLRVVTDHLTAILGADRKH